MDKEEKKIILLLEGEVEDILDGKHNEFNQVESNHVGGDGYSLIFKNKQDSYYETMYYENVERGTFNQQSYAEEVFPKERKVTIIIYE